MSLKDLGRTIKLIQFNLQPDEPVSGSSTSRGLGEVFKRLI